MALATRKGARKSARDTSRDSLDYSSPTLAPADECGGGEIAGTSRGTAGEQSHIGTNASEALDSTEHRVSTNTAQHRIEVSAKNLVGVLSSIQQIARRTNLLALNATIEAARGVEDLSNFSTVLTSVTELRKLGETAIKEIAALEDQFKSFVSGQLEQTIAQEQNPANLEEPPRSGEQIEAVEKYLEEQIDEGRLLDAKLRAALAAVVEGKCPAWPAELRALAMRNIETAFDAASSGVTVLRAETASVAPWPKWLDKNKPAELRGLTSPQFLKVVHADLIAPDGTVRKVAVRRRDGDLMDSVEAYIANRKARGSDLGDADGLKFIALNRGRNNVSREVTFRKKFGKAPPKIIEGLRAEGRAAAQLRRQRRRNPNP